MPVGAEPTSTTSNITQFKDIAQGIQAILTSVGIIGGAIWFFWRRARFPRAKITNLVAHRPLCEGKALLRTTVRVENCGSVLLKPQSLQVWVHQVCPLPYSLDGGLVRDNQTEGDWPIIAERSCHPTADEIEPDEP